jgi:S1-C subfamily serine protease
MGSGFFIGPDLVMTNAHVAGSKGARCQAASAFFGYIEGQVVASVLSSNGGADFAVLKLRRSPGISPLVFSRESKAGDKVYTWGFTGFLTENEINRGEIPEAIFSEGAINKIERNRNYPAIFHSSNISGGNSGGPLLNEEGQVLGVNTYVMPSDNDMKYRVNLSLDAEAAMDFLRRNSIPYEEAK